MPEPKYQGIIQPKGLEGLKGLRGWNELSQEEQSSWLDAHPHAKSYSPLKLSIAYRNNNYLETLGQPTFNKYDVETLGKLYEDKVVDDAFKSYYGNDAAYGDEDHIGQLQLLTTKAKRELLESGHLNDEDAEKEIEGLRTALEEQDKKTGWLRRTYEQAEPMRFAGLESTPENQANTYANLINQRRQGAIEKAVAESNKEKTEAVQPDVDTLYNFYKVGQESWASTNEAFQSLFSGNKEATEDDVNSVIKQMVLGNLMSPEQGAKLASMPTEKKVNLMGQILETSEFNPGRADKMFDQVALPKEVEYKSEFGDEMQSYTLPGSRTYKALKDTDRFNNFGAGDKLREYLTWQVIAQKYGTADAVSALETSMARYAKENEGFKEWIGDVHTNIVLGGIANIMNKVNAISNMGVEAQGTDALANILSGKNPDGSEREQRKVFEGEGFLPTMGNAAVWMYDNALNPYYWSKVDQYNTLDPFMIAEADANGGISPFVTTRLPDEPLRFFSTDTLKEALKMGKFVWSDYLTGRLLGAMGEGATWGASKLFGTGFGNVVGKATALGTVAASGMGIAESYGVMTYEQTYQELMEKLNERQDTAARNYAKDLMQQEGYRQQIESVVDRLRKENPDMSEEDIRKGVENDFLSYYSNQYNESPDQIAAREEDERLARRAAANAYMVDATIEEIRMAAANFTFRKYLFDSGTRMRLGDNSALAKTTTNAANEMELANPRLNKIWSTIKPVWGGFESNYFDDVTVGFGKGFGLAQYNAYLQSKYDPVQAADSSDYSFSFLEGLGGGIKGATAALGERQSFYDGFVGALGSPMSLMPRFTAKEQKETLQRMNRQDAAKLTPMEWINKHFMNPLLDAYFEERGKQERTSELLPVVNAELAKHGDALQDISTLVSGLNAVAEARTESNGMRKAKDAKEKQAFELLKVMTGLTSSPLISEHPLVQNAADEIDRLASGKITEEEITAFLGQSANRSYTAYADARQMAKERIQKNAQTLKEMGKKMSEARSALENSILGHDIDNDLKDQLIYQTVMGKSWTERSESIEETLSGGHRRKASTGHNAIAAYGSKAEYDRQVYAHSDTSAALRGQYERSKIAAEEALEVYNELKSKKDVSQETLDKAHTEVLRTQLAMQTLGEAIRESRARGKELKKDASVFESEELPILSAEEILALNPTERNTILSRKNRANYSEEQQVNIDKAISILKSYTPDAAQMVQDADVLYTRIQDNEKAYRRLMDNPEAAAAYVSTIKASRARQIMNVLRQRRVDDVYRTFDAAETNEELLLLAKQALNSKEYGMRASDIDEYIARNPEKGEILKGLSDVSRIREDAYYAIDKIIDAKDARAAIIQQIVEATNDANNAEEAMAAIEGIIDIQPDPTAKLQIDRVLEEMQTLGHQRDATKLRNREEERRLKTEAENREQKEQESKSGKAHGWDGFDVGTPVYKDGTYIGVVSGYYALPEGKYTLKVATKAADGTMGTREFGATMVSQLSTEKPASNETVTTTEEVKAKEEKPTRKGEKQITKALKRLGEAKTIEDKAQAVSDYETNKHHGAEVTAEEEEIIRKAKEELAKEGYEVVDLLGKKYNPGMKASVSFREDSSLNPGEEIITAVTKPQINKDGEMVQAAHIVVSRSSEALISTVDVKLNIDSEGKTTSPTAEEQAAAAGTVAEVVPKTDATDQGNIINETGSDIISGNRYVEYSIESLKDGVVRQEVPESKTTILGVLREWLDHGTPQQIKLQEIIDEEFGRMLEDNPDLDVRFMMVRGKSKTDTLGKILFNVVELTPEMKSKYHKEERGGVIQANGKEYLVVGTTGFENRAPAERRTSYDRMKAPMNGRRDAYFKSNAEAKYYVDQVAYTRVQNTTSGRIVNQRLGETEAKKQRVSELLKSAGLTLKDAIFGIQTAQAGNKSFATTKNRSKKQGKLFPPRNVEDNRGRTFIILDTANGNLIPGMIEPAMYSSLAENSPLKEMINGMLAKLFSTNYETRREGISELRGYLLLEDTGKNILIGTKDINTLTIRVPGMEDITQSLGSKFNIAKFLKDLENANFQLNVTLKALEDPDMLRVYDESDALMTSVASMRTAGMSYTLYMTDANGKPIMNTPVGNAVPGTGKSSVRQYKSVRVNNVTYELNRNGEFVNRDTKQVVPADSELYWSCLYNQAIKEGGRPPFRTHNGKEYYVFQGQDGVEFVVSRDGLGNVEFVEQDEANKMLLAMRRQQEAKQRQENLEEVDLYEAEPVDMSKVEQVGAEEVNLDDLNRHILGYDESQNVAPAEESVKAEPAEEVQEIPVEQPKEVISDVGTKSLADLQNTENLSTFAEIVGNIEYSDRLYDILEAKGWGITGDFAADEEILKSKGVTTVGITNIEDWLNFIRDCK